VQTLKRTVQRVRQSHLGPPINPQNFNFETPDRFTKTTNGEQFLQFDNRSETNRILLFCTKWILKLMVNCENWFCDGTFLRAPQIFQQLYTIHAVYYSNVMSLNRTHILRTTR